MQRYAILKDGNDGPDTIVGYFNDVRAVEKYLNTIKARDPDHVYAVFKVTTVEIEKHDERIRA
jgi:hypothetical protein